MDREPGFTRGWVLTSSPREKIFVAVIDDVEVKKARELSPRDIEHDNPEFRRVEEMLGFMRQIYGREIDLDGSHAAALRRMGEAGVALARAAELAPA